MSRSPWHPCQHLHTDHEYLKALVSASHLVDTLQAQVHPEWRWLSIPIHTRPQLHSSRTLGDKDLDSRNRINSYTMSNEFNPQPLRKPYKQELWNSISTASLASCTFLPLVHPEWRWLSIHVHIWPRHMARTLWVHTNIFTRFIHIFTRMHVLTSRLPIPVPTIITCTGAQGSSYRKPSRIPHVQELLKSVPTPPQWPVDILKHLFVHRTLSIHLGSRWECVCACALLLAFERAIHLRIWR